MILRNDSQFQVEPRKVDGSTFLGFQVQFNEDSSISLHQTSYVNKIIRKYNMENCNSADDPSTITRNSKKELESKPLDSLAPYREAIGSLMYASTITRLDIAYAVNKASRNVVEPTTYDWLCIKRIFRYLR